MSILYLPLLLSALALLISLFSFFYFKSYLKARTGQERILAEFREEVNNILKSIDETTERDISLIEEREKNLKRLLEDVEKRIKVYIQEMEIRRAADDSYAALPLPEKKAAVSYGELGKKRYKGNTEKKLPVAEDPPPQEPPPFDSPPPETPSVNGQIHSLVKAGFSVPLIASRLGMSITEVELAVALLDRRDGNPDLSE